MLTVKLVQLKRSKAKTNTSRSTNFSLCLQFSSCSIPLDSVVQERGRNVGSSMERTKPKYDWLSDRVTQYGNEYQGACEKGGGKERKGQRRLVQALYSQSQSSQYHSPSFVRLSYLQKNMPYALSVRADRLPYKVWFPSPTKHPSVTKQLTINHISSHYFKLSQDRRQRNTKQTTS